jgi:hypothetical protein
MHLKIEPNLLLDTKETFRKELLISLGSLCHRVADDRIIPLRRQPLIQIYPYQSFPSGGRGKRTVGLRPQDTVSKKKSFPMACCIVILGRLLPGVATTHTTLNVKEQQARTHTSCGRPISVTSVV